MERNQWTASGRLWVGFHDISESMFAELIGCGRYDAADCDRYKQDAALVIVIKDFCHLGPVVLKLRR